MVVVVDVVEYTSVVIDGVDTVVVVVVVVVPVVVVVVVVSVVVSDFFGARMTNFNTSERVMMITARTLTDITMSLVRRLCHHR